MSTNSTKRRKERKQQRCIRACQSSIEKSKTLDPSVGVKSIHRNLCIKFNFCKLWQVKLHLLPTFESMPNCPTTRAIGSRHFCTRGRSCKLKILFVSLLVRGVYSLIHSRAVFLLVTFLSPTNHLSNLGKCYSLPQGPWMHYRLQFTNRPYYIVI